MTTLHVAQEIVGAILFALHVPVTPEKLDELTPLVFEALHQNDAWFCRAVDEITDERMEDA